MSSRFPPQGCFGGWYKAEKEERLLINPIVRYHWPMKPIISLFVCVFVGFGIGWYFGNTRPPSKYQQEILGQYQWIRDNLHMTDTEMAAAGAKMPQYFEDMKRQDEMAAVFALRVFKTLETGDTERAKTTLLKAVGSYYRLYHDRGGDTNFMAKIEEAARQHPTVAAEISRKIE